MWSRCTFQNMYCRNVLLQIWKEKWWSNQEVNKRYTYLKKKTLDINIPVNFLRYIIKSQEIKVSIKDEGDDN